MQVRDRIGGPESVSQCEVPAQLRTRRWYSLVITMAAGGNAIAQV